MLLRISGGENIRVGNDFYRYYRKYGFTFMKGEVVKVNQRVEVDFGDVVINYCISEIMYAINTNNYLEHYTTVADGQIVVDYRPHGSSAEDDFINHFMNWT